MQPWIGHISDGTTIGYIDYEGNWGLQTNYDNLGPFNEGIAPFVSQGKLGFINDKGEVVIPAQFDANYAELPYFTEGCAPVWFDRKGSYINTSGEIIYGPFMDSIGWNFMQGKAIWLQEGNYSIIDRSWKTLATLPVDEVPYLFGFPTDWNMIPCFMPGEKSAYINCKGEVVFPPIFSKVGQFYDGVASFVRDDSTPLHGLVRLTGEIIIEPNFYSIGCFTDGLAPAAKEKKKYGFINTQDEWVIPPIYQQACGFSEGLACVTVPSKERHGQKGFINHAGEMVIEPRFFRQASFHNGWAWVEFGDREGVLLPSGKIIWSCPLQKI